jgi:protein SCO1
LICDETEMRRAAFLPLLGLFLVMPLLVIHAGAAHAASPLLAGADDALRRSRQAEGRLLSDEAFVDQDGRAVKLSDLLGKPLVISLIYTSCDHTCPTTTQTVARAVQAARAALGGQRFSVLSVGFDSRYDTPTALRLFARQQGIDLDNWRFLAADPATIQRLAEDLGFTFFVSSRGFDHLAQTTVVDAQGRVYRQVYGENFDVPLLVEPIKELVLGRTISLTSASSIANRIRFICTVYDPGSDSYRVDYSFFLQIGIGFVSLVLISFVLLRSWRDSKRISVE